MKNNTTNRRSFITRTLLAAAGALLGRRMLASPGEKKLPSRLVTEGEPLKTCVYQGRPPLEPLDTMIRLERSDEHTDRAMTHEILYSNGRIEFLNGEKCVGHIDVSGEDHEL